MKYWHYFYVSDYKGGELQSQVNLTALELLSELCDAYDFSSFIEEKYVIEGMDPKDPDDIKQALEMFQEWWEMKYADCGEYAGAEGYTCPDVYFTDVDGDLEIGFPNDEEIAEYVFSVIEEMLEDEKF